MRNPGDQDMRRLERLAAAGDHEARRALEAARVRHGAERFAPDDPLFQRVSPYMVQLPSGEREGISARFLEREWFDVLHVEVVPGPQTPATPIIENAHVLRRDLQRGPWDGDRTVRLPQLVWRCVMIGHMYDGRTFLWAIPGVPGAPLNDFLSAEGRAISYLDYHRLMGVPLNFLGTSTVCATGRAWKSWCQANAAIVGQKKNARTFRAPFGMPPPLEAEGRAFFTGQTTAARCGQCEECREGLQCRDFPVGRWNRRFTAWPVNYMRWCRQSFPNAFHLMLPEDALGAKAIGNSGFPGGWVLNNRMAALDAVRDAPSLGERVLAIMDELDALPPSERLARASRLIGTANTRPARRLFPDKPRGFTEAARDLQDYGMHTAELQEPQTIRSATGRVLRYPRLPAEREAHARAATLKALINALWDYKAPREAVEAAAAKRGYTLADAEAHGRFMIERRKEQLARQRKWRNRCGLCANCYVGAWQNCLEPKG